MPRGAGGLALLLACCMSTGCIYGSLATSTGPNGSEAWSADQVQMAHVGETVRFSFILIDGWMGRPLDPYGNADYCLVTIDGQQLECEPDVGGRFRFEHSLNGVKPDQRIRVTATAYRQYGQRDFMKVGNTWLRGDSPYDDPDREVTSDSLDLDTYQARVELAVPAGAAPLEAETGKLELIRDEAKVSNVYVDRLNRPGFTLEGPNEQKVYKAVYLPNGSELNTSGSTEARFTIFDTTGRPYSVTAEIPTP